MRILTFLLLAAPAPAFAHVGHVAEVAGHAHWIGLAAGLGAAVLGAWLAGQKSDDEAEATDDRETGEEEPAA